MSNPKKLFFFCIIFFIFQSFGDVSRHNVGIYGGFVLDVAYDNINSKLFAAVEGPLSLFTSSDSGKSWFQSFPDESLEILVSDFERYGWGGRATDVISQNGITIVRTVEEGGTLHSCVISTDGMNWRTLWDERIAKKYEPQIPIINKRGQVTAKAIKGNSIFLAANNIIMTSDDFGASFNFIGIPDSSVFTMEKSPDSTLDIQTLVPLDTTGLNFILIASVQSNPEEMLFMKLLNGDSLVDYKPKVIDSVKGDTLFIPVAKLWVNPDNSDTMLVFSRDSGECKMFGSFDGGTTWSYLSSAGGENNLGTIVVSKDTALPGTNHIRIITGLTYSDDLGATWNQIQSTGERIERILYHIPNSDVYIAYSNAGPVMSYTGINGEYSLSIDGLASITIYNIAQREDDLNRVYLATRSGLAFTSVYRDSTIADSLKWKPPYGSFPIQPDIALTMTAVAISPYDSLLVIAASGNGMYKTTNGGYITSDGSWNDAWPKNVPFENVAGLDANGVKSNGGRVMSIKFYSADTVFAAIRCDRDAHSGGLIYSTDAGESWAVVSALPQQATNAIEIVKDKTTGNKIIYVGAGKSDVPGRIYKTSDGGATWDTIIPPDAANNPGKKELPVRDIVAKTGYDDTLIFVGGDNTDWSIGITPNGCDTIMAINNMAGGVEIIGATKSKYNPDSIFVAMRNKILLLDLSPEDSIIKDSTIIDTNIIIDPNQPMLIDYIQGLPGEIFYDVHYDELTLTSSIGFFKVEDNSNPVIVNKHIIPVKSGIKIKTLKLTKGNLIVNYYINSKSDLKFEIYNIFGRRLVTADLKNIDSGLHTAMLNTNRLGAGLYILSVKNNKGSLKVPLTIVK